MSQAQVKQWIEYFASRSGERVQRIRKPLHTDCPSVQGHWTPFLNLPGHLNVTGFPNEGRAAFAPSVPSATQQMLRLQQQVHSLHIMRDE